MRGYRSISAFVFTVIKVSLAQAVPDPHSFSEPALIRTTHLDLHLRVDFRERRLAGWAKYKIAPKSRTDHLILDTSDLEIEKVTVGYGQSREAEKTVHFEIGKVDPIRGAPLKIPIQSRTRSVTVYYRTSKSPAGLVWLTPEQTTDGKQPFLFSNSEPILGRSWIPSQDSPQARVTYSAEIEVPRGLMALMSAANPQGKTASGVYKFRQTRPVPSYLIALAVGDLSFQPVGKRTGVYAEASVLKKAAREFEDLERILVAGESLFGRYRWGRYDVLLMPTAFPLGGMENPQLTFVMPTVVTGTKSQIFVLTHELSHSWTGNVATNATWNDLWLNEGWTTFAERELVEKIYGRKKRELVDFTYHQALERDLKELSPELTRLQTSLGPDQSPEDLFSWVPYEKGYYFVGELKKQLGEKAFARLTRNYIRKFSFKTVSTIEFLKFVRATPEGREALKAAKASEWIAGSGLPTSFVYRLPPSVRELQTAAETWLKSGQIPARPLDYQEKAVFLKFLPRKLDGLQLAALNQQFRLERNPDPELESEWLIRATRGDFPEYVNEARDYFGKSNRKNTLLSLIRNFRACIPGGVDEVKALVDAQKSRLFPPVADALSKAAEAPEDPNETCDLKLASTLQGR